MTTTEASVGKIWYLKKINLFKSMSQEEMMQLAQKVVEKSFRKKETIYLPGQPGNHVYLLKKGVVKISKITNDGRELTLALLKPGEIFGELEAMGEGNRDGQAEAHSDVLICAMNKNDLMNMLKMKPDLGIRLSKLIGFRRHTIENRLENLVFRAIPEKLAALLLELSEQFGEESLEGIKINLSLTHQDLANLIGATRPTVSETLIDFKNKGLIDVKGKSILIPNPARLKAIFSKE